ncbi:hypothetical protein C8F04DRAFT_1197189 [Mycena alexandri]|uniref:Uncharacterized protein n=1 Tax=Mycena alexandri TaxID=1745969 RepID=A0AAD6S3N1_9AGAR|nr:hypothetical protein C8F04DRAFT_1197189 [Mycena alexandri]
MCWKSESDKASDSVNDVVESDEYSARDAGGGKASKIMSGQLRDAPAFLTQLPGYRRLLVPSNIVGKNASTKHSRRRQYRYWPVTWPGTISRGSITAFSKAWARSSAASSAVANSSSSDTSNWVDWEKALKWRELPPAASAAGHPEKYGGGGRRKRDTLCHDVSRRDGTCLIGWGNTKDYIVHDSRFSRESSSGVPSLDDRYKLYTGLELLDPLAGIGQEEKTRCSIGFWLALPARDLSVFEKWLETTAPGLPHRPSIPFAPPTFRLPTRQDNALRGRRRLKFNLDSNLL